MMTRRWLTGKISLLLFSFCLAACGSGTPNQEGHESLVYGSIQLPSKSTQKVLQIHLYPQNKTLAELLQSGQQPTYQTTRDLSTQSSGKIQFFIGGGVGTPCVEQKNWTVVAWLTNDNQASRPKQKETCGVTHIELKKSTTAASALHCGSVQVDFSLDTVLP